MSLGSRTKRLARSLWADSQQGETLSRLAQAVRDHTIHGKCRYGDCELVADEFLAGAREAGLASPTDSHVVWGWRTYDRFPDREPGQHQWVVIRGTLYDLAADQFGPDPIVIAGEDDPRYREHTRMGHTFRKKGVLQAIGWGQDQGTP